MFIFYIPDKHSVYLLHLLYRYPFSERAKEFNLGGCRPSWKAARCEARARILSATKNYQEARVPPLV
ncbi:hypothetical protein CYMTET_45278 [Cymbomonas tetramitiformis]|uniref:Uncharacterized protein n=1 Tax=Cymbomonas tetramitiformis TaxID=36881 RepID=A0AAE0C0A0_9CHLO|nr:hypothetical protein CYMTET_45278 [Cymbomonas tetramitiformis]